MSLLRQQLVSLLAFHRIKGKMSTYMKATRWTILSSLLVAAAFAAPQPAKNSTTWELDFDFVDIQRVTVAISGRSQSVTYWYLLYTVTNNTENDVEFYPSFDLITDTMEVVTAGDHIHPKVYDVITARHKTNYPFFTEPAQMNGRLRVGTDNARTSAAVFRDFDAKASSFKVFASGLTGEVTRVSNPSFDVDQPESDANRRFFTLRKTLEIDYDLPGDPGTRAASVPVRKDWTWVMR